MKKLTSKELLLEWECAICKKVRPDAKISIRVRKHNFAVSIATITLLV